MTRSLQLSAATPVGEVSGVTALDIALTLAVVTAGGLAVGSGARRVQVGAFLSLGVVLSLIWLRLGSLDVAFAESALGTGLLSAILVWLAVHRRRDTEDSAGETTLPSSTRKKVWLPALLGIPVGVVTTVVLAAVLVRAEQRLPAWRDPLAAGMPDTGLDHEVTGVLLAFRGYDTLLESAVLLIAGVVVLALGRNDGPAHALEPQPALPSVLRYFTRISAPVLLLLGLWLLFAGSTGPGGAFQSGAVFAGMLIMLRTAQIDLTLFTRHWLRPLLVIGVIVFILAGFLGPVVGQPWLTWGEDWAFGLILTVEVFLTGGIAAGLYLLYLGLDSPGYRVREGVHQ